MKTISAILKVVALSVLAGCHAPQGQKMLTVDFQKGQTLRYKFVSSRDVELLFRQEENATKPDKSQKLFESMEMVFAYTPLEVDPYGLTTINATCESVKTTRDSGKSRGALQKDAVGSIQGKTFTFTIGPTGRIEDYSQLDKLILETGEKAFRPSSGGGRIKEPDMIGDFIATQRFLWDSVSSIAKAVEGISVGQTWKSKLSVPAPMVLRKARDVTYTLAEIRPTTKGRLAVIRSSYSPAESVPDSWPMPYTGTFQMSGTFGFLRGYKILSLQGQGEELFNMDAGRTEQYNQQYQMEMEASFPIPLGANPRITIKQNITMQLLEN